MKAKNTTNIINILHFISASSFLIASSLVLSDELSELLEMELEDLVTITIASKREEPIDRAPGIITIITGADIKKFGARNLWDILNRQTSIMMVGGHVLPESRAVLRGALETAQDNQILYLLNGRPITDTQSSNAHVDLFLTFPLDIIEQIEIIRGPGSVLYGSNAFSGIVNIRTKSATDFTETISFSYGSFATKSISMSGGKALDHGWFTGAAHATNFAGDEFNNIVDLSGNSSGYPLGGDGVSAVFSMGFHDFTVNGYISDAARDNLLAEFEFPSKEVGTKRISFDLGHHWEFNDNWYFRSHYAYFTSFTDLFINNRGVTNEVDGQLHLLEFNLHGQVGQYTNLLFGINPLYSTGDFAEGDLKGQWNTWQVGLYSQLDYQWFDWLKLVGGIQFNRPKELSTDISPRAGLIFTFPNEWSGKLLYGEAFRNGEATNRYFDGSIVTANASLKPELIKTFDAQITYQTENYNLALTYYHSRITGIHQPVFIPSINKFQTINSGSIEFEGVELEGRWQITDSLNIIANTSYQTNKTNQGVRDSTFVPNLIAKLGIAYDSHQGYSVALFDSYFGEPTPLRKVSNLAINSNPKARSHHLVTANITFELDVILEKPQFSNVSFSLYLDNLLDEKVFFPNYSTKTVNTSPHRQGRAIYSTIQLTF